MVTDGMELKQEKLIYLYLYMYIIIMNGITWLHFDVHILRSQICLQNLKPSELIFYGYVAGNRWKKNLKRKKCKKCDTINDIRSQLLHIDLIKPMDR